MANRLTWQQVAAPDFSEALRGQVAGAELFSKGAASIAEALGGRDTRLRTEDSNAAISRALQIQDAGEWERMIGSQGIAGLGIDPRRATENLLTLAQTRGGDLTKAEEAAYARQRSRLTDQRSDRQLLDEEAAKLRTQEAMANAFGLVRGSTSKEDARNQLMRRGQEEGWDPLKFQANLTEFDKLDDSFWAASEGATERAAGLAPVIGITDHLTRQEDEFNKKYGANTLQRLYGASIQRYDGVANVAEDLATEIRSKKDTVADEDDKALFDTSAGQVAENFNTLANEFNVAPEVIGMVMRNNIESNGWIFSGDKMSLAMDKARKTLRDLTSPENQKMLAENKAQIERDNRQLASARKSLEKAQREYALGDDRGDQALMDRSLSKITELANQIRVDMAPKASPAVDPMAFFGPLSMGAPAVESAGEIALRREAERAEQEKIRAEPRNRGLIETQDQRSIMIQDLQQKLLEPGLNPLTRAILTERLEDLVAGQEAISDMIQR